MGIDIANNIKAVELLKVEILQDITDLFGDISAEADSETRIRIAEDAANLINMTYLLCSRLGVSYTEIVQRMCSKLRTGIEEQHILERRFGDLSTLLTQLGEDMEYYEKYEG